MTQPDTQPDTEAGTEAEVGTAHTVSAVEQVVTGLAGLDDRPLAEHPEAFDRVHAVLREALSEIRV